MGATAAGIPLGWLIGAMLANVLLALAGAPVAASTRLRRAMIAVLGVMLGSAFSPDILQQLQQWALSLAVLLAYTLTVAVAGMLWRLRIARLDPSTAYFSGVPGGLVEMSLVALALGIEPAYVSAHHLVRIFLVMALVRPAYALWRRLT